MGSPGKIEKIGVLGSLGNVTHLVTNHLETLDREEGIILLLEDWYRAIFQR